MSRKFFFVGAGCLGVAFFLSFLASISCPRISALDYARITSSGVLPGGGRGSGEIRWGIWGACFLDTKSDDKVCFDLGVGYAIPLDLTGDTQVAGSWTRGLAIHPVITAIIAIALGFSLAKFSSAALISMCTSLLAAFLLLIGFAIDLALFLNVRHQAGKLEDAGFDAHAHGGTAFWFTIVELVLVIVGAGAVIFGRRQEGGSDSYPMFSTSSGGFMSRFKNMSLEHLSTTNNAPLDSESRHIQTLIVAAEEDQIRVRNELERVRKLEESLFEEELVVSQRLLTFRGIVSPLRRMPPEILAEVFLCVSAVPEASKPNSHRPTILLSHVCARWRAVARATPKLWCKLVFVLERYGGPSAPAVVGMVLEFSRLCAPYTLDLTVTMSAAYMERGSPLAVLWSCSSRVGALELKIPLAALLPLVGMPKDMFPELKRMVLHVIEGGSMDTRLSGAIPALSCPPQLEELALSSSYPIRLPRLIAWDFHWASLRRLEGMSYEDEHHLPKEDEFTLPALNELTLRIPLPGNIVPRLINPFIVPQLKSLDLSAPLDGDPDAISRLLERSGHPAITKFRLARTEMDHMPFVALLRSLPTVEALALTEVDFDDVEGLFSALILSAETILLPVLHRLELTTCTSVSLDLTVLADMLESRRRPPADGSGTAPAPGRTLSSAKISMNHDEDDCVNSSTSVELLQLRTLD
ncbi:hypothetical protein MKEN_01324600 [Mycena kentingensis (nom. inval.)]|nr:hypothetical protein MKEN_01324600 [Mycena kentingensis (nom. inval.)]